MQSIAYLVTGRIVSSWAYHISFVTATSLRNLHASIYGILLSSLLLHRLVGQVLLSAVVLLRMLLPLYVHFARCRLPYPPAIVLTGGLSTPSFDESAVSASARPGRGRRDRLPPATSFCSHGGEFGVSGDPLPPSSFPSSSSDAHFEDMLVSLPSPRFSRCGPHSILILVEMWQRSGSSSPQTGGYSTGVENAAEPRVNLTA